MNALCNENHYILGIIQFVCNFYFLGWHKYTHEVVNLRGNDPV